MLSLALTAFAFHVHTPILRPAFGRAQPRMMAATPLDVVAQPLRKFEPAAAVDGNMLTDLPFEVVALFAVIVLVGIAGLVKTNSGLAESAPTVGLGESRDDLIEEAATAEEELASLSQADQEKRYFKEIAGDLAKRRGGTKKQRKKGK